MRALRSLGVYSSILLASSSTAVCGQAAATTRAGPADPVYLIIRTDDVGMSHSVNMGLQRLIGTGLNGPELGALEDMNTEHPLPEMSKNRQGELDALTSTQFTGAVKARNVVLMTYRELVAREGLKAMRRPAG